uniref:Putative secreted protein n=1 Tax=Anopheles darlingi TaxID=43151 RepID=A0A2M4DBX9_ANODA
MFPSGFQPQTSLLCVCVWSQCAKCKRSRLYRLPGLLLSGPNEKLRVVRSSSHPHRHTHTHAQKKRLEHKGFY